MDIRPNDLPDIIEGETVRIEWKLKPALNGATIASATWASSPTGLTFTNATTTGDTNTTLAVTVAGFRTGNTYTITATATLSDGLVRKPWARIRCKEAGEV